MTTRRKNKAALIAFQEDLNFDDLNREYPISIKDLNPIIDRIALKYPNVQRADISLMIKIFWEEIRNQLLNGKTIHINQCLQQTHLYPYYKIKKNKIIVNMRIRTITPTKLR